MSLTGNTAAVGNASGEYVSAAVRFSNPEATLFPLFDWFVRWTGISSDTRGGPGIGRYIIGATAFVGLQFLASSGTITGRGSLYGYRKS